MITDFLATEPSPQEIIAYHLPDDLQQRADYLAERNGEDQLTPSEREELDEFLKVDRMFSLLKTKMKFKLKKQHEGTLDRMTCRLRQLPVYTDTA